MASSNPSITVVSPNFILSYPKLVIPEPFVDQKTKQKKGEPVYAMEMIFDADDLDNFQVENRETGKFDLENIQRVCVRVAREKWGDDFDVKGAVKHGGLSWPIQDGTARADEKGEKGEHYRGKKIIRGKALALINGRPNSPNLYYEEDGLKQIVRGTDAATQRAHQLFYGGAICSAELNVVAGDAGGNKYITLYINGVIFEKAGERLGNGQSALEKLRGVKGGQTDYDPTAGMDDDLDDEIPF